MTREEAILILGEFKEFCDSILWNSIYAERSRAIDMAIKALQAEPKEKKDDDSLLTDSAEIGKENECKLSREDARYFLQGISDMCSLSPEAEMSLDMAIEALNNSIQMSNIQQLEAENGVLKELIKFYREQLESVVRCKDCRHRDLFSCPLADNDFQKDEDFCSWGERREE